MAFSPAVFTMTTQWHHFTTNLRQAVGACPIYAVLLNFNWLTEYFTSNRHVISTGYSSNRWQNLSSFTLPLACWKVERTPRIYTFWGRESGHYTLGSVVEGEFAHTCFETGFCVVIVEPDCCSHFLLYCGCGSLSLCLCTIVCQVCRYSSRGQSCRLFTILSVTFSIVSHIFLRSIQWFGLFGKRRTCITLISHIEGSIV